MFLKIDFATNSRILMKDLLVTLVQFIFDIDDYEDITLKRLIITAIKVFGFILIVALVIWIAIKLK